MDELTQKELQESETDWTESAQGAQASTPTLRSIRGTKHRRLEGKLAAMLARGPVLLDLDDD